jgi:arylsulfatase A-like enzyme
MQTLQPLQLRAAWLKGLALTAALSLAAPGPAAAARGPGRPNIVYVLCDDLGYGDVRCLNPQGKIATPNIDKLAAAGMIFTDAHSSSSVCSPTRYSILTGRYNWRSRLQSGVLGGMSPRLIEPGRLTVPAFLQQHGYHTACIGKWHLGLDWQLKPGAPRFNDQIEKGEDGWRVDFTKPFLNGPRGVGFDYFYGISASLDMAPYAFLEDDRVTEVPTTDKAFPLMPGKGETRTRRGPAASTFDAMRVLPELTQKAVDYIHRRAGDAQAGKPFFLYLALSAPHTPILPTPEWQGRSGLNPYADFVMQTDWTVGEILAALDRHGLAGNTLVIFTSDNGCSPEAKFPELAAKGHHPSSHFRGYKADVFEGGHRVPFIVRWPGRVRAGAQSDQLVCLTDLFATCAEILGARLPDHAAEDSVSFLPVLERRAGRPLRHDIVHHSINGSFAIREKRWKLALCPDSGGWSPPRLGTTEAAGLPPVQLYDLATDIGERQNVSDQHPEVGSRLTKLLEQYVAEGRSTPGTPQTNTIRVRIHRTAKATAQP